MDECIWTKREEEEFNFVGEIVVEKVSLISIVSKYFYAIIENRVVLFSDLDSFTIDIKNFKRASRCNGEY